MIPAARRRVSTTRTDGTTRTFRDFQPEDFVPMEKDLDGAAKFLGAEPRLIVGAHALRRHNSLAPPKAFGAAPQTLGEVTRGERQLGDGVGRGVVGPQNPPKLQLCIPDGDI